MPFNSFEHYPLTWKPTLDKSQRPLYAALAKQLEDDIANGTLKPGTKLPPQRELADYLDINLSTVSRAFKICAQKGLLSSNVGSGTYVAYDVYTNIFSAPQTSSPHLIELGSLTPETVSQEEAVSLLQKMILEPDFDRLFQYTHSVSDWQIEAATRVLTRAGCPASPEQVLIAGGGQNAIAAIFAGLFQPGDRLGVDPLIYPGLKSAAKLFGIQLTPIQQERGEMSEEGLYYALKNEGIRGIYVMPDCHNPTTHTMSENCRRMIARIANENSLIVIEDGINSLLLEGKRSIFADAPEQTIYSLSLSKTINPGLRLAYLAVPKQFRAMLDNALYNINLSQSALLVELASRLIVSGHLDSLLSRRKNGLKQRNQLTDEILRGFDVKGDSASLSRWLCLPPGMTGAEFEHTALEHGVFVYGSERFAVGKDTPAGAARLSICAPADLSELRNGLKILRSILESL